MKENNENNENKIILDEENIIKEENLLNSDNKSTDKDLTIYIRNTGNYVSIIFVLLFFIMSIFGIISSLINSEEYFSVTIILFFVCILVIIMIVQMNTLKIKLIKDESKNLLIFKKYNLLNCKKKNLKLFLENYIFDILIDNRNEDDIKYHLLLINTFKNISEIDLEQSTIKETPVKIYYLIRNIKCKENIITKEFLNKFIGASPDADNPIIQKNFEMNIPDIFNYKLKKVINFSKNFFSYYFKEPYFADSSFFLVLFLINILYTFLLLIYINQIDKYNKLVIGINIVIICIINGICIWKRYNKIKRMDVVCSSDFKNIFLGLVKYYERSYKKCFIFEIDNIEKFVFEKYKNSNKYFILKIIFKNNENKDICIIENEEDSLNRLLIALNNKLEKNENENNDIQNDICINSINT